MNPENSDVYLLSQLEQGDPNAFNTLYSKYWEQVYSAAFKRLKDSEQAKDIVQEVFTRIWINRKNHIDNLPAYLHISVRNSVIKISLKRKRMTAFVDLWKDVSIMHFGADEDIRWKEFSKAYEMLIGSLPPKRQAIYRMRYHEGMNTEKIAARQGLTRKTVQNQLGKAVEQLRISLMNLFTVLLLFVLHPF